MTTYKVSYTTKNTDGTTAHHTEAYNSYGKAVHSYNNLNAILRNMAYMGDYSFVHLTITENGKIFGEMTMDAEVF